MKYIELPVGVTLEKNSQNYHYFTYSGQCYLLEDILANEKMGIFKDDATNLSLAVLTSIPKEDKLYVEYLPNGGKPAKWCEIVNGKHKNNQNNELMSIMPWIRKDGFYALREDRKQEIHEARSEQKQDRYEKGPKSY